MEEGGRAIGEELGRQCPQGGCRSGCGREGAQGPDREIQRGVLRYRRPRCSLPVFGEGWGGVFSRAGPCSWSPPDLAEPVIGPAEGRTRWLGHPPRRRGGMNTERPIVTRNRMDRFIDAIEWGAAIFVGIRAGENFLFGLLGHFFSTTSPAIVQFGPL